MPVFWRGDVAGLFPCNEDKQWILTNGFVKIVGWDMAGVDQEWRIDRERAGIDREMAGIDPEIARKQTWIATVLVLLHFGGAGANAGL